jgi:hypothetical protein
MKPLTSVRSAEQSSRSSRRRPTRNRHNRPMKNHHAEVVPKVHLVGLKAPPADQAGHLGRSADLLVGLRGLPVDQAGHLVGAEDDGQRKA